MRGSFLFVFFTYSLSAIYFCFLLQCGANGHCVRIDHNYTCSCFQGFSFISCTNTQAQCKYCDRVAASYSLYHFCNN
ncbi:hypothetical protein K450DRAFT_258886 [Umbelopsis ramanniana AG]|uniref:EGF-like domain-containing protein n=1 Tax=Umbelopsis ramanniana AG TaxID=1314678 RepID=A0AAD5H8Y8_UMBRA|nr:uncharacterized protein K450DRAFT_258886 [Umbelopsis ramanniana AG]KAI8576000.1 hypothetical protein K450DRAFT_258886 [Umbelopsis ramanniana AG]